ncbi:TIM barrel protein [Chitinophaga sp. SYP-B3965]|uniref:sugar phosphate isomerase/epimerase family protein n=1 Tax=Chitinophaga sp. SYP-B3965 TaxID=2663120 RepID=UPI0012996881|nr:sugar phosphate isomerase/epimerase family protein [Chitinophaga sp. SYP-B3965]MRG45888.1 TIM barrel protein [Chitinophaga sp. SYP-B3965]
MKKYAFLLLFILLQGLYLQSNAQKSAIPPLGVCTSFENDSLLHAAGFAYIEESARKILSPAVPDSTFERQLARIRKMKMKVETCNLFMPATIRLFGKEADEKVILGYVDSLMQRAKIAGIKIIVFGSAGSRKLLDGQDPVQSKKELIAISRKMAEVAKKYDRIIAMESLNTSEDNFMNSLKIVTDVAQQVNHPNFRLTVDLYHMMKEGEDPKDILKAGPYLVHCHIAEKEGRRAPGTNKEDFKPYFAAMRQANYKGRIMIESGWKNMAEECKPAFTFLSEQLNEVYK